MGTWKTTTNHTLPVTFKCCSLLTSLQTNQYTWLPQLNYCCIHDSHCSSNNTGAEFITNRERRRIPSMRSLLIQNESLNKASSLLGIHDHEKKRYSHKKDAAVTCTTQYYHQHDVCYGSKAFNLLILIKANSTNIRVRLLPKMISSYLHLEEDSLGLLKTLGVYSNPCKCGLVYIEQAQCSSKTRLRKHQWYYLPSNAK